VAELDLGQSERDVLIRIPMLRGGEEVLTEARGLAGEVTERATARLAETYRALAERGLRDPDGGPARQRLDRHGGELPGRARGTDPGRQRRLHVGPERSPLRGSRQGGPGLPVHLPGRLGERHDSTERVRNGERRPSAGQRPLRIQHGVDRERDGQPVRDRHLDGDGAVASYAVNERGVARARELIEARQYVLDSNWGDVQPRAADQDAFLASHTWDEYAEWHLGLTEGASDGTKARHAFVYGDFRRVHRSGIIACHYRAAEWRHKEIELAAHRLLQLLDETAA